MLEQKADSFASLRNDNQRGKRKKKSNDEKPEQSAKKARPKPRLFLVRQ
jgi:hypothetical protein